LILASTSVFPGFNLNTFKDGFLTSIGSPGGSKDMLRRNRRKRGRTWEGLPIVRLQRMSLTDYPGRLSAKVVVPGCNFRCPYCPNEELIFDYLGMELVPHREVLDQLYRARGYLTGLTIGGGEPTLHNGLLSFTYRAKSVGYKVKLDTNGTRPRRLNKLMEERVVDYVSMEIKAPLDRYPEVVRFKADLDAVRESIRLLRRGSVDYEFTTTVVPGLVGAGDIEEIAKSLIGSRRFVIRTFNPTRTLDPEYTKVQPYGAEELQKMKDIAAPYFAEVALRN